MAARLVIAQPVTPETWQAWCPAADCDGLIGTDGDWATEWTERDFAPWHQGCCVECGRLYRVRRP